MERQKVIDLAQSYAAEGFLCSESVLKAISNHLEIKCKLIPRIATGLGAGIGGQGMVCGAVSGGILALGIRFGRNIVKKEERKAYWFALEFLNRFKKEHRHLTCRELTGCDFNTAEGYEKYDEKNMWETKCRQYIATAVSTAFDIIKEKT
ncbi:MAG: C_GCAxxG_C_C family protein [Candidatus Bathyarchaeota archaeon]|nr:MAG: C_GCAxxG_C_C family protein [Candidatus Bathyarchaeota archaeon]